MSQLEPTTDDDFEPDPDAGFEDLPEQEPVTAEQRARAMGWKPLDEYRGDPRRWTDAETFIAHGEEELPILRDQNRRLSEKVARNETEISALRNTVGEQTKAIQDAMRLARRADEAGYQRGLTELKVKQREAVEAGDTVAYDQVQAQIDAAERERAAAAVLEVEAPPPASPPADALWPETTAFLAENPWMNTDRQLAAAMVAAHTAVLRLHPNMSRTDQYDLAKSQVIEAYPDRFPEDPMTRAPIPPRVRPRAAVQPPSAPPRPRAAGSDPFLQIEDAAEREEARAAFDRIRTWDLDTNAGEYVSLYLNPRQNPLELRAQRKRK